MREHPLSFLTAKYWQKVMDQLSTNFCNRTALTFGKLNILV